MFSKSTCLHACAWAWACCTGPILLKSHAESKLDSRATRRSICLRLPQLASIGPAGKPQRSKSSFGTQRSPRGEPVPAVTSRKSSSAVETVTAARHMSGGAYNIQPERRIRHLTDVLTKGPRSFDAVVIGAGTRPETVEAAQACFRAQS